MCNFNLKKPCSQCPFRTDVVPFIRPERAKEICASILAGCSFPCHKTLGFDDEGESITTPKSEHCAGSMIMLERLKRPNQMMRISERLGLYDHTKLQMDSPVYDTPAAMVKAHQQQRKNTK